VFLFIILSINDVLCQKERCGTEEYYESLFRANPAYKRQFNENQRKLKSTISGQLSRIASLTDTIPLVIHIVASEAIQQLVSEDIIQSQIDVLNEDFQGLNADSIRIPSAFKPLFGKSNLFFKLAGISPLGEPTHGIVRVITNNTYTLNSFNNAKFSSEGGSDAWDPTRYLNIWVISFGNTGILGYSVFPGDPRPLHYHGFVCDYRAFGKNASYLFPKFNKGRTTTHELGHFFNLKHTWNEENKDCTGSDFSDDILNDDTPNQHYATRGNPDPLGIGVVKTDGCSPTAPGIMYQNFMDYTDDQAVVMFTKGQQVRMFNTLTIAPDRSGLLSSFTYQKAPTYTNDARILNIVSPSAPLCKSTFEPIVVLRNSGNSNLTSVRIECILNNQTPIIYNWTGNLLPYTETQVSLPTLNSKKGVNTFYVYTSQPNGFIDEHFNNDTAFTTFEYIEATPLNRVVENFSNPSFPPAKWKVVNKDDDISWAWNGTIGKNESGCIWFNDWNNTSYHRYDDLVTPGFSYSNKDSIFLLFSIAAATYSNPSSTNINLDTLTVLVSKDCGNSFSTVYKKWGKELQTLNGPLNEEFFPNNEQWRRDSVNLSMFLGTSEKQFQVYFRFSGNYENNIFLDDVILYTKEVPQALKDKGVLILPTVFNNQFNIWHYQKPKALNYVKVFNSVGQLVWSKRFNNDANTLIDVNLSGKAAGIYFVKLEYQNSYLNVTQRVLKY
jgi:hypothetical protein